MNLSHYDDNQFPRFISVWQRYQKKSYNRANLFSLPHNRTYIKRTCALVRQAQDMCFLTEKQECMDIHD